MTDYHAVAHK